MSKLTPEDVDAVLPQTQCGLCGHGGCMPYAEAMIFENENINLCPPGGIPVLHQLGKLLNKDASVHEDEMRENAKPKLLAVIREAECIGCTKCIQACPVDAILGSSKSMHTVISDECTGCELCVAPCPVDCIDLIEIAPAKISMHDAMPDDQASKYRERFNNRESRIAKEKLTKNKDLNSNPINNRKDYLQAALARAAAKKTD